MNAGSGFAGGRDEDSSYVKFGYGLPHVATAYQNMSAEYDRTAAMVEAEPMHGDVPDEIRRLAKRMRDLSERAASLPAIFRHFDAETVAAYEDPFEGNGAKQDRDDVDKAYEDLGAEARRANGMGG